MSLPTPPVKLEDHCSVIHNNTLYVYTPKSFLSLPLELNGKWKQLPKGLAVSGATCVKGGVDGDNSQAALYVVGGTTDSADYYGLQRYSFQKGQWEALDLLTEDIRNRTHHGAAYLNTTSSILVYAGSQDGNANPSTQTFTISTSPPYDVTSYMSQGALPAVSPMLLPWDDSRAALLGGDTSSTRVFVFNPEEGGWADSGASLAQGLPDQVRCALVQGSDGSKVLETFDMSTSPNTVTRVALLDAGGVPARPGQLVGTSSSSTDTHLTSQKRDLTLADYPPYNGTFAPKEPRTGYSLAQDRNGLVVISGGSETDPICIFDQSANRWLDASRVFDGDNVATATGASGTGAATLIASGSSSAAIGSGESSKSRTNTIIGAILGSILGFAALLVIALLVLRRLRKKKQMEGRKERNGESSDDPERLNFQGQGMEPLARSAFPMARGPVPSADSFAIMSGKYSEKFAEARGQGYGQSPREPSKSPLTTILSSRADGATSAMSGSDQRSPQRCSPDDRPRGDRRTDEGWSRYFQDNDATDLVRMESTRSAVTSVSAKSASSDGSVWPRAAVAGVTPLNIGVLDQLKPLGRVHSGSPSTEHVFWDTEGRGVGVQPGQSAQISSVDSVSLASDDGDLPRPDAFSSGIRASVQEGWSQRDPRDSLRPPSSTYSNSLHVPPAAREPSTAQERLWTQSRGNDTTRSSARQSSVVIQDYFGEQPHSNINSDMSWLNLAADK
ncbi:hypothetical protein VTN02DRAFT_5351 [Thermoascus thermophilus]